MDTPLTISVRGFVTSASVFGFQVRASYMYLAQHDSCYVVVNEGKLQLLCSENALFRYSTSSSKEATDRISVKDHLKRSLLFYGALASLTFARKKEPCLNNKLFNLVQHLISAQTNKEPLYD